MISQLLSSQLSQLLTSPVGDVKFSLDVNPDCTALPVRRKHNCRVERAEIIEQKPQVPSIVVFVGITVLAVPARISADKSLVGSAGVTWWQRDQHVMGCVDNCPTTVRKCGACFWRRRACRGRGLRQCREWHHVVALEFVPPPKIKVDDLPRRRSGASGQQGRGQQQHAAKVRNVLRVLPCSFPIRRIKQA